MLRKCKWAMTAVVTLVVGLMLTACGGGGGGGGGSPPVSSNSNAVSLSISTAQAIWLNSQTIVWPSAPTNATYTLYYSKNATLAPTSTSVAGSDNSSGIALSVGTLSSALAAQYPQYASATALTLPTTLPVSLQSLLTNQLIVVQSQGAVNQAATQIQLGPVLDAVYGATAASATLGVSFSQAGIPIFKLWAPTATAVSVNLYTSATGSNVTMLPMTMDSSTGIWSVQAPDASLVNVGYYTYTVNVYSRAAAANGAMVANTVTDPYSVSLSGNSLRSMILDLTQSATQPAGWPGTLIATSATPTDSVIYELHVRDFSVNDPTVPVAHQGKFLAFTEASSAGMLNLKQLSTAGLTHIHLLPAFDFSSVDELNCSTPTIRNSVGAGTEAETDVKASQTTDCFNWGYDPQHYGAPEGSYSSAPDNGLARVLEFRQLVQSLHSIGLRVVMDVVYNHTSAAGQDAHSVLDKIVPGYYYRLDGNGNIQNYSCCSDTATERVMMEKLMTDTLVRWSQFYLVDGFRFDILGMLSQGAVVRAKAAVEEVTAKDARGHTYFYGEGWIPNSAVSNVVKTATQANLAGTGIGTFNDRIRDSVRGGGPFDSGSTMVSNQGFISGQCYQPNSAVGSCTSSIQSAALAATDLIRISLAGNLASFPLRTGVTGASVLYGGQPAGYTQRPEENIAYVSVHDNETLFDVSQYKHLSSVSVSDRARAQAVGLSMVILSQGVPFIHGGDDYLRSKSGDSNSYNSGDYFNRIDWSGQKNYWATGLPPDNTGNNSANVSTLTPLLNSLAAPDAGSIAATHSQVLDFLSIRKATDLFRLTQAQDIIKCVSFPDATSPSPGVIVMRIQGQGCVSNTSSGYKSVVVVFNASASTTNQSVSAYGGRSQGTGSGNLSLHPVQSNGSDSVVKNSATFSSTANAGTFTVPPRTTAVFVEYP